MDAESKYRVGVLVEEWKVLSRYIEAAFGTLEKLSSYIVILIGVAAGIGTTVGERVPPEVWLFAGPAVLTLLFRMLAQLSFSYFQAKRLIDVEKQIQEFMKIGCDKGWYFHYGHEMQALAQPLRQSGTYAYLWWLRLVVFLGFTMVIYSAGNACFFLWEWPWLPKSCQPALGRGLCVMYGAGILGIVVAWFRCKSDLDAQFEEFRGGVGQPPA